MAIANGWTSRVSYVGGIEGGVSGGRLGVSSGDGGGRGTRGLEGEKKRSGSLYTKYLDDVWHVLAPPRTRGELG
jgi:hypothetical protein